MKMLARVGEYGFVHNIPTGEDLSATYTSASIFYKSPSGTVTEKTCDSVTAADGDFGWAVTEDFFDEEGVWEAQLKVVTSAGNRKLKDPILFRVGASGE